MNEHEFGDDVPEGQQAQRRMDEFFRALVENALDVITILDAEGVIRYESPSIERVLGYKPAELIGMNIVELLHPDDAPKVNVAIKVIAPLNGTPGVAHVVEARLRHKDGSWRILESIGKALPSGTPVIGIAINSRDITERKRADEERNRLFVEIQQRAAELDAIFKTLPYLVSLHGKDGQYLRVNPTILNTFGFDPTKSSREEIAQRLKARFPDGQLLTFKNMPSNRALAGETVHNIEYIITDVNGNEHTLLYNAIPWKVDGEVQGAVFAQEDITERKRAEEAVRHSHNLLDLTGQIAKVGGWDLNLETQTLTWTEAVYRIHEVDPATQPNVAEAINFYAPEAQPVISAAVQAGIDSGTPWDLELQMITAKGRRIWVRAQGVAERHDGKTVRLYGAFQDITERKRVEERIQTQLRRLAALRAIDTAIVGSIDLRLTLNVVVQQTVAQLGVDAVAVLLLNQNMQTLTYAAGCGFRGKAIERSRLRLGEGYAGRAALERHAVSIHNFRETATGFTRAEVLAGEDFVCYHAAPLIAKGHVQGVLEIFVRSHSDTDEDWIEFFEILTQQAAIALDNAQLFDNLQRSIVDLSLAYNATIEGWSHALDLRDKETEGHALRVTELTERLARAMGIGDEELVHIRRGALLHDIGKMGVPDGILLKPGKLTDEEWVLMCKHPQLAFGLLSPIVYLKEALDIPYCHHEKWDGSGYPRGLKGEQIPLAARIFAVVDVWDALISDRPYRKAWTKEKALEHIQAGAGTHFDPQVVKTFLVENG